VEEKRGSVPSFEELDELRTAAEMTVERFCARLGIPRSTWYYWRSASLRGRTVRRWPAPVVDVIEEAAARKAEQFSAWGHRKVWALLRNDGIDVSPASVRRALARRGLLLPPRYQAERRQLAKARRAVFEIAPTRRNRIWQMDFSAFETTGGGLWNLTGVVDYAAKVCLTCPATGTQTAREAVAAVEAAILTAEDLLEIPLVDDCVDPVTGEVVHLVIVSDNGPAFKSDIFARFVASRPYLAHVRTRFRSPQTNGVVERFFGTLKYDHLYRDEINDAVALVEEIETYLSLYNDVRPHEHLGFRTPREVYLAKPAL
jgi:transposase InsO family protein